MISAAEQHVVGWPLPASLVARIDSRRSRVAMFFNAGKTAGVSTGTEILTVVIGGNIIIPGCVALRYV